LNVWFNLGLSVMEITIGNIRWGKAWGWLVRFLRWTMILIRMRMLGGFPPMVALG
jgi:hypothetical protein